MSKTVTIQAQQRWDYRYESRRTENSMLATLNEIGQHGWELVSTQQHKDPKGETCWTAFLKRPNAGAAPVAGQSSAAQSSADLTTPSLPAPSEEKEKQPEFQGFDLSGDEFPLKGE